MEKLHDRLHKKTLNEYFIKEMKETDIGLGTIALATYLAIDGKGKQSLSSLATRVVVNTIVLKGARAFGRACIDKIEEKF